MTPFATKLQNGEYFVGFGLSDAERQRLADDGHVTVDLASVGVGFWVKEADGSRNFIQPRDSNVVIISGDTHAAISKFLGVELP